MYGNLLGADRDTVSDHRLRQQLRGMYIVLLCMFISSCPQCSLFLPKRCRA
jgi:hypothetical protein